MTARERENVDAASWHDSCLEGRSRKGTLGERLGSDVGSVGRSVGKERKSLPGGKSFELRLEWMDVGVG